MKHSHFVVLPEEYEQLKEKIKELINEFNERNNN